eukprot:CAMPEP_0174229402 /NCGR_PEP_ID=MMETSP0417-20130205/396_1 /TAXON_ID=242541 /ORGANISM="Mayorella sp, Strain BSH-02190019" /LENGTH=266 /DNA_ID=CAMNT_0015306947 /DNA_START=44 /DNA_END=841 /DNA_ORIENTATION=+
MCSTATTTLVLIFSALFLLSISDRCNAQEYPENPLEIFAFHMSSSEGAADSFALLLGRNVSGDNGDVTGYYESLIWQALPLEEHDVAVVSAMADRFEMTYAFEDALGSPVFDDRVVKVDALSQWVLVQQSSGDFEFVPDRSPPNQGSPPSPSGVYVQRVLDQQAPRPTALWVYLLWNGSPLARKNLMMVDSRTFIGVQSSLYMYECGPRDKCLKEVGLPSHRLFGSGSLSGVTSMPLLSQKADYDPPPYNQFYEVDVNTTTGYPRI